MSEEVCTSDACFAKYVTVHGAGLVCLARALLADPRQAEDLVRQVLAGVLADGPTRGRLGGGCEVGWTAEIDHHVRREVIRRCTSVWRRKVRRGPGAGDVTGTTADQDTVLALLHRLPALQRGVLVLRHYEAMADADIAWLLDTTQAAVQAEGRRAMTTLRESLVKDRGRTGR